MHGGAARAAYRTQLALRAVGVDSWMLVQDRRTDDPRVVAPPGRLAPWIARYGRPRIERTSRALYGAEDAAFDGGWWPSDSIARATALEPDVVHLHWVGSGFVRIEHLARLKVPWVWTLHDMWAFTGGCFYPGDCRNFEARCGRCPTLESRLPIDASRWAWRRRARVFARSRPTLVAPSRWMADKARRSGLLSGARIEVIPNGVDLDRFTPRDRRAARRSLGLPEQTSLVLFGAVAATEDRRKGFDLLAPALARLATLAAEPVELVVFGSERPAHPPDLGLPARYLGALSDETALATLYAAADVFVLPSREDNSPNTVVEALACGTPCVAFEVGGVAELVDSRENGVLAPAFDSEALAQGILWCLDRSRRDRLGEAARAAAAKRHDLRQHGEALRRLYEELLSEPRA